LERSLLVVHVMSEMENGVPSACSVSDVRLTSTIESDFYFHKRNISRERQKSLLTVEDLWAEALSSLEFCPLFALGSASGGFLDFVQLLKLH
jgi:hypothetical protein